jgi:membrane associated rhomboid family serine protease
MPPRINIPPVTRIVLIVLGVQSVLSAAIRYRQWSENSEIVIPYLNLIPQLSLVYPWTFLTTTLVESNVFTLSIACATLYNGGRYLERAWSSREFAKFLLVTALVPNALCFVTSILFFALTRDERWTYVDRTSFFTPGKGYANIIFPHQAHDHRRHYSHPNLLPGRL